MLVDRNAIGGRIERHGLAAYDAHRVIHVERNYFARTDDAPLMPEADERANLDGVIS